MKTKKRLVYHLYSYEGCFESKIYKIHLACLSYFAKIFDEAIFIITLDNVQDYNLIKYVEKTIIENIFIKDIKFIVKQNDNYHEASTFYEEIVKKLPKLDGITFFGHTKGAGNQFTLGMDMDQVNLWVIACYFFSLHFMDEVRDRIVRSPEGQTYGSLKCAWKGIENKYDWIYSGTFFWINCQRLYNYAQKNEIEIPEINNRYYAETFCGNILDCSLPEACSHDYFFCQAEPGVQFLNWYKYADQFLTLFLEKEEDKIAFEEFKNNILSKAENEK